MRSRFPIIVAAGALAFFSASDFCPAKDPPRNETSRIRDGAYYEFRGHIYDRSTIEHNFTLYWSAGSQPISVTRDTKIYRKGVSAALESVKSGDAVCGIGQVRKGQLIAVAVAFGDDGVELPEKANLPRASMLPAASSSRRR
jgi:hypothetical protein